MPKFRFQPAGLEKPGPEDTPRQLFTNPHLGEIEAGQVYDVPAEKAHLFTGHPDWAPAK